MIRGLLLWVALLAVLRFLWRELVTVWTGDDSRGWWV